MTSLSGDVTSPRPRESSMLKRSTSRTPRLLAAGSIATIAALAFTACSGSGSSSDKVGVALIVKTTTNPYFVAMEDAAQADAAKASLHLPLADPQQDGDA